VRRISGALARLNARVYDDLLPLLAGIGLSHSPPTGALTLYETEDGYRRDAAEWASKRAHGIATEELAGTEVRRLEPALGPRVHRAVYTPQTEFDRHMKPEEMDKVVHGFLGIMMFGWQRVPRVMHFVATSMIDGSVT
jgi:glycine/D-amino acid oxidase-like deaminating enzyme